MAEVEVRGARFHVQRLGRTAAEAPTVVFLHGLIMDNLSSWYFSLGNQVGTIADALLYDLRGHGKSTRTKTGYGRDDMVADLAGVLDASGLVDKPVILVGNSLGGLLALAFAIRHPERTAGLVLVDAQVADESWGRSMVDTLTLEGKERDKLIYYNFKEWRGRHSERKRNRLVENAHELVHETSLVSDLAAYPAFTDEELAGIRCRVLALYGTDSDIKGHGERLERLLANGTIDWFDGCSHSIIWEGTARLRERVVGWIEEGEAAGSAPEGDRAAG